MITSNADNDHSLIFDFGCNACADCNWFVVLDGVMGGRSSGTLITNDASVTFAGDISLANRGGFASMRTPFGDFDLRSFDGLIVRYRSIGQSFAITLNNHRRFYLPRFKAVLPNTDGQWSELRLSFADFKKMRFSEVLGGGPSQVDLQNVMRLGLISNDKVAGPYELEVDYLKFISQDRVI